jgi:hypothetical protein
MVERFLFHQAECIQDAIAGAKVMLCIIECSHGRIDPFI